MIGKFNYIMDNKIINKLKKVLDLIEISFDSDDYVIGCYNKYKFSSIGNKYEIYEKLCQYIRKKYVNSCLSKKEIVYLIKILDNQIILQKHIKLKNLKAVNISNIDILFMPYINKNNLSLNFFDVCYAAKIDLSRILSSISRQQLKKFIDEKIENFYNFKNCEELVFHKECFGNLIYNIVHNTENKINDFVSFEQLIELVPIEYIFKMLNYLDEKNIINIEKVLLKYGFKKEYNIIYILKSLSNDTLCIPKEINEEVSFEFINIIIKNELASYDNLYKYIEYLYSNKLLLIKQIFLLISEGLIDIKVLELINVDIKKLEYSEIKVLMESNYIDFKYKESILNELTYLENEDFLNDIIKSKVIPIEYKLKIINNEKYLSKLNGKSIMLVRDKSIIDSKEIFKTILNSIFDYKLNDEEINNRYNTLLMLLKGNNYLYKTINYIIFDKKFYKLDYKILEYISRNKELGEKVEEIYFNNLEDLFIYILNNLNINIIYNKKLFNKILLFFDLDNKKLILSLNKKNMKFDDLMKFIYKNTSIYKVYRMLNYGENIDKNLIINLDNEINSSYDLLFKENKDNLYLLKNIFFNKYFDITVEEANEFNRLFFYAKKHLEKNKYYYYLEIIGKIININNIKEINKLYYNFNKYYTNVFNIECYNNILSQLLKNINSKTLKVEQCKKIYKNFIIDNRIIKKHVYIPPNEFFMIVHSTDAYGKLIVKNNNYLESWTNNENIQNTYFSCSVISNKYLGVTHIRDVLLGFSYFFDDSLVHMAPYDLYTNNSSFFSEIKRPASFMIIEDLINNSRHTHNEIVFERNKYNNNSIIQLYPSFVIIFSSMSSKQISNAIKCSDSMKIPIVYIDVLKQINKERKRYLKNINNNIAFALNDYECNRNGLRELAPLLIDKYFPTIEMNNYINRKLKKEDILELLKEENKKFKIAMEATNRINFFDISIPNITEKSANLIKKIDYDYLNLTNYGIVIKKEEFNSAMSYIYNLLEEVFEFYANRNKKHGIEHIERVMVFSYIIGQYEHISNEDLKLLLKAVAYHDIARENDSYDKNHGYNSALVYLAERNKTIENYIVAIIIAYHELVDDLDVLDKTIEKFNSKLKKEKHRIIKLSNVLKDADSLDRARFQNPYAILNPKYLRIECSKKLIYISKKMIDYFE